MNQLNLKQGLIATFKECTAMNKNERTHELVKRREKAPGAAEKWRDLLPQHQGTEEEKRRNHCGSGMSVAALENLTHPASEAAFKFYCH